MNFDLDEQQQAVAELAEQIIGGQTTVERIKAAEAAQDFDRRLWSELAGADLLGLCLAESAGGSGMGAVELALLCRAQGRHVIPAPLLATLATAMVAGEHGQDVSAVIAGSVVMTAALSEPGANLTDLPSLIAVAEGDGYRLRGERLSVPYGQHAGVVVVPARVRGDVALFAVHTGGSGVTAEPISTTDRQPAAHLALDVLVPAACRFGDEAALTKLRQLWLTGQAATVLGVCEGALAMTAEYIRGRQQFGRPLATFQAAGHRAADAYITTEALRVAALSAAWQLDNGDDAAADVLIAAYWASEGGQRVTLATQHLHGGIGADIDYPIHRRFLWATQLANSLGTVSSHLAELGALIASGAPA